MEGATFVVTVNDLWRTIGNAAVAVGKDVTLPVLTYVEVTVGEPDQNGDATLTAAGTDRYALFTDTCHVTGVTQPFTFLLSAHDWSALDRMLKGYQRSVQYVWATVEAGNRIRWTLPDGAAIVTACQDGGFPKWRSLIPNPDEVTVELLAPIAFNPQLLARLAKLRVEPRSAPVRMTCTSAHKAVRIDMGDTLCGVVMPVRIKD